MVQKMINAIFKILVLSLFIVADVHLAYAQTAQGGIVPNGEATFLDKNGKPLTSGKVYFYTGAVGSTTPKTTYSDINLTTPNSNPVVLDAGGRALIWGTGTYRQQVKDRNNNLIWDVLTSAAGSGGGGGSTATGDGDLVGTIKPWAGPIAPNQYMFTYGQELSRVTYAALFTAITSTQSVFCTSGSAVLNGVGDTTSFWIGMKVEVPCVASGVSTVASKTSSSVTLAANANVSENVSATFFMWGNGNGSTTFNLPDFRGLIPMGNNIMGGIASANISDTYFGSQSASSSGGQGGGQTVTLASGNIPQISLSVSGDVSGSLSGNVPVASSAGSWGNIGTVNNTGSSGNYPQSNTAIGNQNSISASGTMTGTAGNATPTPFGIIPPSKTVNYIIKVTPDANSATANGVTDINGMTGSIGCVSPIVCTGNNITSIGVAAGGSTTQVQYNNTGALAGSNCFIWVSPALTVGLNGTCGGQLKLAGATSGVLVQQVASVAGMPIITWGNATGTPAVTASAPLSINTTTGNITCTICLTNTPSALTGVNDTNVTLTLGGTPSTALLAATSITLGWTGTLAAARLNSNVVQSFTNDTNITASISAQNATLGWTGQLALSRGGTGQSTALAARGSSGLNIDEATSTGDANYTILSTDRMVYHTALSAARTDTLPAANSVNAGQRFVINDFRGVSNATNTITLQRAGTDTINGVASVVAINAQYGAGIFWSDGVSRWTFFPTTTGGGGGTVTSVGTAGLATGGPISTSGTVTVTAAVKADQTTATSTTVAVVPGVQQYHPSAAKAWVNFTGASGTINASYNVASVSRSGAGNYTVNFTTAFADTNYACVATAEDISTNEFMKTGTTGKTTTAIPVLALSSFSATADPAKVNVICFGNQ